MSTAQRQALDAKLHGAGQLNASPQDAPQPAAAPTIDQLRAGFATMMSDFVVPDGVRRTPTELAGVPAVLVEPEQGTRPDAPTQLATILYFHGGSFVVGSPQTAMALTAQLVLRTGVRAVSLDYRLAPEHPFPAAIEDCLAAYRSLLDGGTPPTSIAFAGDSAGGGLTVTTCLAARDAGLPMPAAIVAFSPGADHTRSGASMTTRNGLDPYFTPESFAQTGAMYLAGADPAQPLLAPAVHADLTGLPAMLLQVGTHELLLDDSVRLARRAVEADVDVVLDVTAGVPHVFPAFAGMLDEADQALDRAALFLHQHLVADAR